MQVFKEKSFAENLGSSADTKGEIIHVNSRIKMTVALNMNRVKVWLWIILEKMYIYSHDHLTSLFINY